MLVEKVVLQDIFLADDYLKLVTDEGTFICESVEHELEQLSVKSLKLVGKNVKIIFLQ